MTTDSPKNPPPSDLTWDQVVVRFGEIALKGRNRGRFIQRLQENLHRVVNPWGGKVRKVFDHLTIDLPPEHFQEGMQAAARVFGVVHVTPVKRLPLDINAVCEACVTYYRQQARPGASFGVKARRSDKQVPMRSGDVQITVGTALVDATGAPVNLSQPEVPICLRIVSDSVHLLGAPVLGPGGLPAEGRTRRLLTLFSGGIDSPVAAWHLMRRGGLTDFVHLHVYPEGARVFDTKLPRLAEALLAPQAMNGRLHLLPYDPFQMALLAHAVPQDLELILFRRHLFRTASELARRGAYPALVTGDNLSQVASQTLENLLALEGAVDLPVFRPLLTYDKQEIVDRAQSIGTFDLSVEAYKDCCSLVSRRPDTRPRLRKVLDAEARLPVETITAQTLERLETWRFENGSWQAELTPPPPPPPEPDSAPRP